MIFDNWYDISIWFCFCIFSDQRLTSQVHEIVGRINGRFGTLTAVPIHHLVCLWLPKLRNPWDDWCIFFLWAQWIQLNWRSWLILYSALFGYLSSNPYRTQVFVRRIRRDSKLTMWQVWGKGEQYLDKRKDKIGLNLF